jgi:hypothetical protein
MKPSVLVTFVIAAIATVLGSALVYSLMVAPLRSAVGAGNRIHEEFQKILNLTPRITANQAVIFSQNTPVLELVTVERSSLVRHRTEETWLHSTKTFEIEATFSARAGLNLRDLFTVNIPKGGRSAEVQLPRAKILSIGMSDLHVLRDENGLWNTLSAKDREKAIRALERTAKAEFLKSDILAAARTAAEAQIRPIVELTGCEATFVGSSSAPAP